MIRKKENKSLLVVILCLVFIISPISAKAATIYVPENLSTIQAGINAASPGDTVEVAAGVYHEILTMKAGVNLFAADGPASTIIYGGTMGSVITIKNVGHDPPTIVDGFTIVGGFALRGGGIYIEGDGSSGSCAPIIRNCIIGRQFWFYGGLCSANYAYLDGAGISCYHTGDWNENPQPQIVNCTIAYNGCRCGNNEYGGGISAIGSSPRIINSTIVSNCASWNGDGIFVDNGSLGDFAEPRLVNTIVRNNDYGSFGADIGGNGLGEGIHLYNCNYNVVNGISNVFDMGGNINQPSSFINPGAGDYHLDDTVPSACIDTGRNTSPEESYPLPNDDIEGDSRPSGSNYDIGSDEIVAAVTCLDNDLDGYGVCPDCDIANGCDYDGDDCNDGDPNINPVATDVCNGVDDDCDGTTDEDYVATDTSCGIGACVSTGQLICQGGSTVDTCVAGTPAPSDANCDGVDDDCDGTANEDYVADNSCFLPGICEAGNVGSTCVDGIETACQTGTPGIEICDGLDNDCNGGTDDEDTDGDGVTVCFDMCPEEDATGFDADSDGCIDTLSGTEDLINNFVDEGEIGGQLEKSLIAKITKAAAKKNVCDAIGMLESLKNQTNDQRGNKITEEAADLIIAYVDNVITDLMNQLPPGENCNI